MAWCSSFLAWVSPTGLRGSPGAPSSAAPGPSRTCSGDAWDPPWSVRLSAPRCHPSTLRPGPPTVCPLRINTAPRPTDRVSLEQIGFDSERLVDHQRASRRLGAVWSASASALAWDSPSGLIGPPPARHDRQYPTPSTKPRFFIPPHHRRVLKAKVHHETNTVVPSQPAPFRRAIASGFKPSISSRSTAIVETCGCEGNNASQGL